MNPELTVTIGDLAETVRGVTYEKADSRRSPHEGYSPLIRATNIENGSLVLDSFVYVPDTVIADDQRLRVGDIVLAASSGSLSVVGKAALVRHQWSGTFGAFCYVVRPRTDRVLPDYLAYFMQTSTYRSRVSALAAGVNINNLRREHIENIDLTYCALAEQRRIVDAVDSYLSRLDDAVASLEGAQAKLKAYRASVLKAAVEGRLVPTEAALARAEKRDYEPADVLFARILKERRRRWEEAELARLKAARKTPKDDKWKTKYEEPALSESVALPELPEGWTWTRISLVGDVQLGRQRAPAHHQGRHMRPYLRVANVFEDRIDTSDVMMMNFTPQEFETYRLGFGDILLNEGQSPHLIGRPAMYRDEVPGACFQNTLIRFRATSGVDPRFALIVFRAQLHARRYMRIAQITTNIAHLGAGRFAEIEFPLPPTEEQKRIADEVERLLSIANSVDSSLGDQQARSTRLRQAVLKWAFEGKLVDQDPTDEPADKLLARVRSECAAVAPIKNGGRRRKGTA